MCGINAIITFNNKFKTSDKESVIHDMNDRLSHRGPDYSAVAKIDEGIYFGHRRLSIIDLSSSGHQPMQKHNFHIIYNGEIYNYLEIRSELCNMGYEFVSQSDTEVILSAFHAWGPVCLNKFNGMWSIVIYDATNKNIFVSRDRFGKKPLFYFESDGQYYFTSELKAFKAIPGFDFVLNKEVAFEYLVSGAEDRTNATFIRNVRQFPAGCFAFIDHQSGHGLKISKYYDIAATQTLTTNDISFSEAAKTLRSLVFDAVNLRLRADVTVASALSGGIDSSIITACAQTILNQNNPLNKLHTFTSLFTGKGYSAYNEEKYAISMINLHRVNSTLVFPDAENFIEKFDHLVYHQDEPFISAGMYAQYKIYESMHANQIKVSLDGQGVDEAVGGYSTYNSLYLRQLFKTNNPSKWQEGFYFIKRYPQEFFGLFKNRLVRKEKVSGIADSYFKDVNLDRPPLDLSLMRNMSVYQIKSLFLPAYLQHQDRNSMAFSVESRSPFMDYRVMEFLLNIPDEYKIKYGIRKYILREAFKDLLPALVYSRYGKMGFPAPLKIWMQNNHSLFRKLLKESLDLPMVYPEILHLFDNQINLNYSDYLLFFRVIVFSRWVRMFDVKY